MHGKKQTNKNPKKTVGPVSEANFRHLWKYGPWWQWQKMWVQVTGKMAFDFPLNYLKKANYCQIFRVDDSFSLVSAVDNYSAGSYSSSQPGNKCRGLSDSFGARKELKGLSKKITKRHQFSEQPRWQEVHKVVESKFIWTPCTPEPSAIG